MAEGDTDVSICSQALLLLGANQITSFADGTAPSSVCLCCILVLNHNPWECIPGPLH